MSPPDGRIALAPPGRRRSGGPGADVALLVALGATAAWAALGAGGRVVPLLALLGGAVAAGLVGRAAASTWGQGPTLALASSSVAAAIVLSWPGATRAGGAPTGYANATATLAGLGVVAALVAARQAVRSHRARPVIRLRLLAGATCAVGLLATRSAAGVALTVVAVVLVVAPRPRSPRRRAVLGGLVAVAWLGALGTTAVLALDEGGTGDGGTGDDGRGAVLADVDDALEGRPALWAEAVRQLRAEPLRGVGVGGYASASRVSADPDLRWAHHEVLEVAAEQGAPGLVALVGLLGGVLAVAVAADAASRAPGNPAVAVVALVAGHGLVDHVWHAPAVVLVAAAVLGTLSGPVRAPRG